MTIRTHDSQYLRTSTESTGSGIQGNVTVGISVSATLTRERTIPTDIQTRVYPAATLQYSQPAEGDIILPGFVNSPQFGTLEVSGGVISVEFTGFTNPFTVPEDHVVGRKFGVVEGWHAFEGFEVDSATFGDFELIQELYVSPDGFDGSEETFGDQFMVTWDVIYDLDANIDISGDLEFGEDTNLFFGIVEDNWVEDAPLTKPWEREL